MHNVDKMGVNFKKISRICLICNKSFSFYLSSRNSKYCSRSCFFKSVLGTKRSQETKIKLRNGKLGDKNPAKREDVRLKIGKTTKERLAKNDHPMKGRHHTDESKRKISQNNWMKGRIGNKSPHWLGDNITREYPLEFSRELKSKIRERDAFVSKVSECMFCGQTEEEHKKQYNNHRLTIHHIDYNKENNNEDNLITLCHTCNVRANSNREFNQKFYRRKIQQIGVLVKLKRLWIGLDSYRFCQLVSNLHGNGPQDIFHTEDDDFEKMIDKMIKETDLAQAQ